MCVFLNTCHRQNDNDENAILSLTVLLAIRQHRSKLPPREEHWSWPRAAVKKLIAISINANRSQITTL